ncbi:unnamed protein product [Phaeothamnion confervicola]
MRSMLLNNLGAALGALGRHDEGYGYLQECLRIDPDNTEALLNTGAYLQEEGLMAEARDAYRRADALRPGRGYLVRTSLILPPVADSEAAMAAQRAALAASVAVLSVRPPGWLPDPVAVVERVQFYLPYYGANDRPIQEAIARMYLAEAPWLADPAPHLLAPRAPDSDSGDGGSGDSGDSGDDGGDGGCGGGNLCSRDGTQHGTPESSMSSGISGEDGSTIIAVDDAAAASDVPRGGKDRQLRVAFVSKYFGEGEPHGLLLVGVARHLPRRLFRVLLCPVAAPGRRLSAALAAAADEVIQLGLTRSANVAALAALRLDILVYADVLSEPVTHFLAFARLAPVQAAFWGNPVTTGNPSIDYFITADVMEHPNRTILMPSAVTTAAAAMAEAAVVAGMAGPTAPAASATVMTAAAMTEAAAAATAAAAMTAPAEDVEAYSEQAVLLGGQGIWYDPPDLPPELHGDSEWEELATARAVLRWQLLRDLGLAGNSSGGGGSGDSRGDGDGDTSTTGVGGSSGEDHENPSEIILYVCPQSLFKLHPRFDRVVGAVLAAAGAGAHIVFTAGRRRRWTDAFAARLRRALSPEQMLCVHIIPRVGGGDAFVRLLAAADVVLHPFPFGGSRTSAEALAVAVPTVALATLSLRGRMAHALYATLALEDALSEPCCTAVDEESYVALAVRLGRDAAFRWNVSRAIHERAPLLWGRREVVYEWARFLATACGVRPPRPEEVGLNAAEVTGFAALGAATSMAKENKARNGTATTRADSSPEESAINPEQPPTLKRNPQVETGSSSSWDHGGESNENDDDEEEVATLAKAFAEAFAAGALPDAEAAARAALALHPDDPGLLNDLGAALHQQWRLAEAVELFAAAAAARPGYAAALGNMGVTLAALGRGSDAERWYRAALAADLAAAHEETPALLNLANLMRDGGRPEEAVALLTERMALPPLDAGGALVAAISLFEEQPYHQAALRELQRSRGWAFDAWAEVRRVRERFPTAANELCVWLGWLGRLPDIAGTIRAMSGAEPLLTAKEEARFLPAALGQRRLAAGVGRKGSDGGGGNDGGDGSRGSGGGHGGNSGGDSNGTGAGGCDSSAEDDPAALHGDDGRPGVHLIMQRYCPGDARRQRELDFCLKQNLANPHIAAVHLLSEMGGAGLRDPGAAVESATELSAVEISASESLGSREATEATAAVAAAAAEYELAGDAALRQAWETGRLRVVPLGRRMTFADAFRYADAHLASEVVAVANADIFFDESLGRFGDVSTVDLAGQVYALRRWESEFDDEAAAEAALTFVPRIDSQDAWIFRAPLPLPAMAAAAAEFPLGRPRCDNRLAAILMDAGLRVSSPSLSLVAHHVDSRRRSGGDGALGELNSGGGSTVGCGSRVGGGVSTGGSAFGGVSGGDNGDGSGAGLESGATAYPEQGQVPGRGSMVWLSDKWLW